jgi:dienelactone hydrolase
MFKPVSSVIRSATSRWSSGLVAWLPAALLVVQGLTAAPRALPPGELPLDRRLQPLKDLDGYFPFTPPASKDAWVQRAEQVRRRLLVSQGLWPLPTRTPLNAVIHGRIDRDEYTVEKVYFESAPGFFVTGNLYRPKGRPGKRPGVLFAHGHWQDARLSESVDDELMREIATGQERFVEGGRSRFQSMCVQLARMGCVVWQWDMLGNSDSQQFSAQLVHGFAKQRPEMNAAVNWGFFSPQAEAHLQSVMGLQTWNAIRSLDFLLDLPEVDPDRVAMTGASGGGTQTMLLAAVDPRLTLAFPAVMVSTAMQGGCTCENASLLRVDTGNVEFAALFAPKPQGMTTANDWTKEMATKGFPELRQLYTLLGAPDAVMLQRGEHFPHNYNAVSRSAFYGWLNRHFRLGFKEPVIERDYARLTRDQLTVWDAAHPAPKAADPEFERALLRLWHDDSQQQLTKALASTEGRRELLAPAIETLVGRTLVGAGDVVFNMTKTTLTGGAPWSVMSGLAINRTYDERPVITLLTPTNQAGRVVLWLTGEGRAGLFDAQEQPLVPVQRLLRAGWTVCGVDLFLQGEFLTNGVPVTETRRVKNPREAAAYTFGYNHSLFAQRVHDVLTVMSFLRKGDQPPKISAVALGSEVGPILAAARAVAGGALAEAVIDTGDFRFAGVDAIHSPGFLPGGAKYLDVPGLIAAAPTGHLLLADRPDGWALVETAFGAAPAGTLARLEGTLSERADRAVKWLLERD